MTQNKIKYFIEAIIHALFWLAVYYALRSLNAASVSMTNYSDGKTTGGYNAHMLFEYALPVLIMLMVMFYGNIFWLFKKLIRHKNTTLGLVIIIGWFVLLFAINYFVVRAQTVSVDNARQQTFVDVPASPPRIAFSIDTVRTQSLNDSTPNHPEIVLLPPPAPPKMTFSADDWWGMQPVMAIIFLAILGTAVAYFFIKEWISNNLARSHAEAQQLSTEVKFLRSQVNPHFLFNTLNNLFSMAQKKGDDEVADGISKLSGMMRYMIYESNTDIVPLQKEIEYLQDCVALNKLRYADNEVTVNFTYPSQASVASVQIAPMLFIPFLENAFKHGVLVGRNSSIAMAISVNQKTLTFTCENTDYSTVKKLDEESTGIGLENVKRRLELVYPNKHELRARAGDGKYTVNLKIDIA